MGWAARRNQWLRMRGIAPAFVESRRGGPRWYRLRLHDAFGAVYRVVDGMRIERVVRKVRGKAARRADKRARRLGRP